jgi:hypothetical protein
MTEKLQRGLELVVIDRGICSEQHPAPLLFVHGAWHAAPGGFTRGSVNVVYEAPSGFPSNLSRLAISATGLRVSLLNCFTGLPIGRIAAIA